MKSLHRSNKTLQRFFCLKIWCIQKKLRYSLLKANERVMQEVECFIEYLAAERGYSQQTLRNYRDTLVKFSDYISLLDQEIQWTTIDADIVRNWMAHEMQQGLVARTINRELSALRSFYKYLLRMNLVKKDPLRMVHGPKTHKPLPYFLKEGEVKKLFEDVTFPETFIGLRDRTILLTFYHTGIRLSELIGLNVADVDLAGGELKVTGKRNKQRIVPFGEELRQALAEYIKQRREQFMEEVDSGFLFFGRKKKRLAPSITRAVVVQYLSQVTTMKKRSPHVLRHTFATEMLNHGADLEAIKEILGHESVATTEVYTHTTFADLKKEYQHAHPRA